MRRGSALLVFAAASAGCAPAPHTRAAGAVSPLAVRAVAWNPAAEPVGRARAVADAGDVVTVFGDEGAWVFASGALVATDRSVTGWVDAGSLRGADGAGRWIVGVDRAGRLHHLRGMSAFDDVTARYGLGGRPVRALTMLDGERAGFALGGEIAVADGARVTRYGTPAWTLVGGGAGVGAGVGSDLVVAFDARTMAARTYALPGATGAAVGPGGRLYASTARAIYAATSTGDLALVYDAARSSIHGLVAAGPNVWFADGTELGLVRADGVAETTGAGVAPDATLASSPSGDVWVLSARGLQRFAPAAEAGAGVTAAWAGLGPIFARACASCHEPGGPAGVDLSNASAWERERGAIRDRVVASKTMPPEGHPLSEADRAAIEAWAGAR